MPVRILVVDDDPNVQRTLSFTLQQEGYDVAIASDGEEALKRWADESPDLMLLDVGLPKVDGYQVATRIREAEAGATHMPIIMLTADADVDSKVKGLRAGADDYQVKPFFPAELVARIKSLLARFAPKDLVVGRPPLGRILAFYGAKGGVGTTTLAINSAVALHRELNRKVALVDGNLQFGDHRVFLDLGLDRKSIVDVVQSTSIDQDLVRSSMVKHDSGIDLLLAPPSPESAELVSVEQHHVAQILEQLRTLYDYTLVDIDKRFDETNLDTISAADTLFVVMTADLSCLKNVRLVLETMTQLGVPRDKVQLILNRSNAFTGIAVKDAENVLKRKIEYQIVNEYRAAISALNSGAPFMYTKPDSIIGRAVIDTVRSIDRQATASEGVPQLAAATT
ncbi:MAG TPA: response regulator [Candidatus Limnocylindrales bacterium]|jgi:pilus assembly protein CpaE